LSNNNISSKQYVDRTNTALQKLGVMGISVLVSDGDDGAASLGGATGNCPIDASKVFMKQSQILNTF
jgi:hypothetical protein